MSAFAKLKKRNKKSFEELKNKAMSSEKKDYSDDRIWVCERDKAGNGYAVIRFLDVSQADIDSTENPDELVPWAHLYTHNFKSDSGRWFVDNCPTTHNEECPVCKANSELWATEIKDNQEIVRKRKRKQIYYSNIYVVKDSANPHNEGKVFLFKYGPKIFAKIKAAMNPEFEDEVGFNPFDMWEGANFKVKVKNVENYVNYDSSEFDSISPLADTDEEIEEIWSKAYSLQEFVSKDKFKSFDELQKKLNSVLGIADSVAEKNVPIDTTKDDLEDSGGTDTKFSDDSGEDVDDDLDYFRSKLDD